MMAHRSIPQESMNRTVPPIDRAAKKLGRFLRGLPGWSVVAAVFVVLVMVSGSATATTVTFASPNGAASNLHLSAPLASPLWHPAVASHPTPQMPAHLPHELAPAAASPHPSSSNNSSYVESGRASFFTNTPIPNPTAGNNTCAPYGYAIPAYYCWNTTTEPTLNLTTDGYTGLAYTAYTNQAPCSAMDGNATTEVGFVVSTDFGLTWTAPMYLGNPVCTGTPDQNYSSAFEPSLTSLPNGTFVLSYIEFNASFATYGEERAPPESMSCSALSGARLVVTMSYNHGTTWTTPTVINATQRNSTGACPEASFPDVRPQIAAFGDTLYLTWVNSSNPLEDYYSEYSSWVNLVVSTNGGSTWSAPVNLTVIDNTALSQTTNVASNPSIMVDPSGRLYIAYATNFSYGLVCGTQYCTDLFKASVIVATSTNNGSSFSYVHAADGVVGNYPVWYPDVYQEPFTTMAYSSVNGQAYLAYGAATLGTFCYNEASYGVYCGEEEADKVFFQNSSTNGATWSAATHPSGWESGSGWDNYEYNPSMAVDSTGKIDLQYAELSDEVCLNITTGGYYCGQIQAEYVYSTNNGTNWSTPLLISGEVSYIYDIYRGYVFDGFTSAALTEGTGLLFAWTQDECPNLLINGCENPDYETAPTLPIPSAEVVASQLYEGAGLVLTFNETGLPSGHSWLVNIQGNVRNGPTGTNLSISGVPPSAAIGWITPWVNTSYGRAWYATPSVTPPSAFTTNTAIVDTFSELLLVNVLTVPAVADSYCWTVVGDCNNVGITPVPGPSWVTSGTTLTYTESTVPLQIYCYQCDNLSFLSWSGIGAGSVSTTSSTVTFTPTGPVNETASFQLHGICFGSGYIGFGYPSCLNYTYALNFEEKGLPAGTEWGGTLAESNGTSVTNTSTAQYMSFTAQSGTANFDLWTVPASGGMFWVPTTTVTTPVGLPYLGTIVVTYTLEALSSASFATTFGQSGLPNGTAWSLQVGGTSYGIETGNGSLTIAGGVSVSVNGSAVYLENGSGYYVSSILVLPYVINETSWSISPGGAFTANGSSFVLLRYSPMFRVSVTATVGGTVTPPAEWVVSGVSVQITETALTGFHFVDWSGTGAGSYSGGTVNPTMTVRSAINEFATFRPDAPPTWNVTLNAIGLPAGTAFTISIGGTTYTGLGAFKVGNLTQGLYAYSVPTVFLNSSQTTQFVPTDVASPLSSGSGSLNIDQNGTVSITYTTQYSLSVATTPGGSVMWGSSSLTGLGTLWFNASAQVSFVATPDPHYYFVSWNGTGSGSVTTATATLSLEVLGPVVETAQFQYRPNQPPATYDLNVSETGLPSGTAWSVALGALGASGSTGSLTVVGLNGTYGLTAPAIYTTAGIRWVSNAVNLSTTVGANGTFSVSYSEQFEVTVLGATGGSVTPLGTEWVAPGSAVDLAAVANSTSLFLSWNGTGNGNYTGTSPSQSVTVTGPITEQVAFGPQPVKTTSSGTSPGNGELTAIGLLVVLLVVGLVVGLLMGRRRSSPPPMTEAEPVEGSTDAPMDSSDDLASSSMTEYDEGPGAN
jgi:List-Bact-rpt repeat protein